MAERISWHDGFAGVMNLTLRNYIPDKASVYYEHVLGNEPPRVDALVIKKEDGITINEDIALDFRKYNVVEYKSPDDEMGIDEYYMLLAYMCRYKAITGAANEVKADEVTGMLIRQRYPAELFQEIERLGGGVTMQRAGIYAVSGLSNMPTEIVVLNRIDKKKNIPFSVLTKNPTVEDVLAFLNVVKGYTDKQDLINAKAVFKISQEANPDVYEAVKRRDPSMSETLMNLLKDEIEEEVQKGREEGRTEGQISTIRAMMKNLGLSAERAMQAAGIPESEYSKYMKLLGA